MFFNRNSSLPPIDPYTSLPRGRSSLPEQPLANHLRTTSASFTELPTRTSKQSKRHTYHELQASTPAAGNRVVSLPSTHETFSRGRSYNPSNARSLKQQTPSLRDKPFLAHSRRLENTDPRALLRTLNTLLNPQTQRIPDYLDVDNLMALHERDLMEREQRDAIKVKARTDRAKDSVVCSGLTVFGSSLREATMYASHGTVLGGYEHDLPVVVFRCVQELCRHDYRNLTPQAKPDRERLLALISAFDSEPHFGWKTPLDCPRELREICALLTTYLFALPDPLLGAEMFEALWAWCVLPSLRRTDFLEDENRVRCHVPADAGVHIAQLLLRLLPLPNFSLVVYMMGFFKRLPHMVSEDVGRAVFAGRSASASNMSDGRAERAETMLRWFLDRWDVIFKELFPLRDLHQKEDAPTRSNNPWSPRESYGDCFGSVPPVLGTRADAELTPRVGQNGGNEPPAKERAPLMRLPSDGLFEKPVDADSDTSSISSSPALGERLMDVTLEDAQLDKKHWNRYATCHAPPEGLFDNASVSNYSGCLSPEEDHDAPPSPQPPEERDGELTHRQTLRRISLLERELERSDVAVGEAISETFKAREQVKELEAKLRAHEREAGKHPPVLELTLDRRAADDWYAVLQADTDALKRQLEEARKERDAALQLVEEIKRLMRGRGFSL